MKDRLCRICFQIPEDKPGVFEGVIPLLDTLEKERYILAVASRADRIKVEANLKAAGIREGYFERIIAGRMFPGRNLPLKSTSKPLGNWVLIPASARLWKMP